MEEEMQEEEMSTEDIAVNTEYVLNKLIDLLVSKGVIREEELQEKLDEDDEDECEECEGECTCE
ncbi:hypothetical protein KY329_03285 [Candidatus Woesearchaeota archaeon]|nr:hypothetical protein [Candidatus Woesearchaeota archaeon]